MTGSIGVVTINLARLGYLFKQNREALFARLGELLDLAKSCLEKKRAFVQEMYDRGLYPYTKRYLPPESPGLFTAPVTQPGGRKTENLTPAGLRTWLPSIKSGSSG